MAGLEEQIFEKSHFQPYLWLRYLDDIFCIWTEGLENLKEFFGFLNNVHPSIKFTMEYSQKQINFSDVLISKNDNESSLVTSLFTKSTDSHQYLHATSCHRSIYKKSIPYGQAIRMKRICSNEVDLQRKLLDLESWLTDRGYKSEIIRPEIQKVNLIDRNNLLKKRPKHQEDSITLVLTFHPALNIVFDVLKKAHWHVQKSHVLKVVLPKPPRIAFRNPKTLRDKLVRSKLKLTDDAKRGNFPCRRGNCEICNILKPGKQFNSMVTGEIYKMNFHFDCKSLCVIYLITCKMCKKQYTGSTVIKFRACFNQYKSNLEDSFRKS